MQYCSTVRASNDNSIPWKSTSNKNSEYHSITMLFVKEIKQTNKSGIQTTTTKLSNYGRHQANYGNLRNIIDNEHIEIT